MPFPKPIINRVTLVVENSEKRQVMDIPMVGVIGIETKYSDPVLDHNHNRIISAPELESMTMDFTHILQQEDGSYLKVRESLPDHPDISYRLTTGAAPVQIEGLVGDDRFIYFRERGGKWALYLSHLPMKDFDFNADYLMASGICEEFITTDRALELVNLMLQINGLKGE